MRASDRLHDKVILISLKYGLQWKTAKTREEQLKILKAYIEELQEVYYEHYLPVRDKLRGETDAGNR